MNNKLATINLEVRDLPLCLRFYRDVFGVKENAERSHPPGFYYLESPAGHLTLQPSRGGKPGTTIELGFEVEDLVPIISALSAFPGSPVTRQSMSWGNALETKDPEGHRILAYKFAPA